MVAESLRSDQILLSTTSKMKGTRVLRVEVGNHDYGTIWKTFPRPHHFFHCITTYIITPNWKVLGWSPMRIEKEIVNFPTLHYEGVDIGGPNFIVSTKWGTTSH